MFSRISERQRVSKDIIQNIDLITNAENDRASVRKWLLAIILKNGYLKDVS